MKNLNIREGEEMHTALGVSESQELKAGLSVNEEVPVSNRRGRKGAAQAAQSLGQRNSKASPSSHSEVYRVVISKESNDALDSAVSRCAEGFDAGTFTKSDIANYIFQNISKFFSEADVKNLRAVHFDEKKVLGSFLRTDIDLPEELKKAIRAHYGVDDKEKKKSSKKTDSLPARA
ncbi:MAG: hypothetical protein KF865_05700 [Bdellovibrionaceae bacterium]|nr:hypothetical protein [Pseudobdellovibrionaceae bacterium]